ncbi:MAG TPA: hypothetical protein VGX00_06360 [Thermoplasmata archaeon]|nr:hypothetical protein [Thermoplasmata archaeon]
MPTRPRPGFATLLPMLALALAAVAILPAAGAAPFAASGPASAPVMASTGVWAWGAFENSTYQTEVLGAYADSLNLTSGNLSSSTAVVGELSAARALYGAYTVVNATAPTATTRSVIVTSVALANYTAIVEVAGNLPKTGTYAPGAAVPLVNVTGVYYVSILDISAYVAYTNYTLVNGTLSLANEHVEAWVAANETVIIYHWPGYVNHPNGSTTVTSTTAAWVSLGWVAESFSSTFTPALPIAKAPLSVGENWTANTSAHVVGWAADASASAYQNGATNTSARSSGGWSLNTTAALGFSFRVVGSESVVFPNGTTGTGYTIVSTENGTGASAYTLWDGLAVLPAGSVPSSAPAAPAAAAAVTRDAPSGQTAGTTSQTVVYGSGFPVATDSPVSASATLKTAPLNPSEAKAAIQGTVTPTAPKQAVAPAVTQAPTLPGTTGTTPVATTPPADKTTPTPTSPAPKSGVPTPSSKGASAMVSVWVLAAAVAGMVAVFVGIQLVWRRRSA